MNNIKTARILSFLLGILLIIAGILALINPIDTSLALINWVGALLLITGVIRIIRYFTNDLFKTGVFLVGGILDLILGIYMFGNNITSLKALTMVIGFWELFGGISSIAAALDFKRFKIDRWYLGLLSGGLSIIFGYMLITDMQLGIVYISLLLAIHLFVNGLVYISTSLALKNYFS